jgi:hypothetical protein
MFRRPPSANQVVINPWAWRPEAPPTPSDPPPPTPEDILGLLADRPSECLCGCGRGLSERQRLSGRYWVPGHKMRKRLGFAPPAPGGKLKRGG